MPLEVKWKDIESVKLICYSDGRDYLLIDKHWTRGFLKLEFYHSGKCQGSLTLEASVWPELVKALNILTGKEVEDDCNS